VAEVSFPAERYARCEIVKVSSVLDMVDAIVTKLIKANLLESNEKARNLSFIKRLEESKLVSKAAKIALMREYPVSLSKRTVAK
jgi:hypothetical protein